MNKTKLIKQFEYDIKLIQLRIKYSKHFWETIGLTMLIPMLAIELRKKILQQPKPNFKKGGIVGGGGRAEVIVRG